MICTVLKTGQKFGKGKYVIESNPLSETVPVLTKYLMTALPDLQNLYLLPQNFL